jgi:nicotinic acid mononucleotide adenylyltransferase
MNKVIFTFGRFQPPTRGHEHLFKEIQKKSIVESCDHYVFVSRTKDKKSNPLDIKQKIYYLKQFFPSINFVESNDDIKTFFHAAKFLNTKYNNLIMMVGEDRVENFNDIFDKYNGKEIFYDTINVISVGDRDTQSTTISGISSTKLRNFVKENNFMEFHKYLPSTTNIDISKKLFMELKNE